MTAEPLKPRESQRVYAHPLPVRLWHWINAASFVLLILTGLQLRYGAQLGLMRFGSAVRLHNWVGLVVTVDWFVWAAYYLTSPRIRCYLPHRTPAGFWRGSLRQLRYYGWGMFVGEPNPHRISLYDKFNPLQAALYRVVMVLLLPLQAASGVLMWQPQFFARQIAALGGLRVVDSVHVTLFAFFLAYILLHPYLGTLGPTRTGQYKAMLSGWEEGEAESPDDGGPAPPPPP